MSNNHDTKWTAFEIDQTAEKMATRIKKITKLQNKDTCKLFLYLYREQFLCSPTKSKDGLQAGVLADFADVQNEYRLLGNLETLGLVKSRKDLLHGQIKYYSITEQGKTYLEEILKDVDDLPAYSKVEVETAYLPQIIQNQDQYNIIVGTLSYLYTYDYEEEEPPNLLDLSKKLKLEARDVLDAISDFSVINEATPKKDQIPLFKIELGESRFKRFLYNCNDWVICNYFCTKCQKTTLDLLPIGEKMCGYLIENPQMTMHKPREKTVDHFFVYSIIVSFIVSIITAYANSSFINSYIYYILFLLVVNFSVYIFLKNEIRAFELGKEEE